jgi:hypothetical protein
MEKMGRKNKKRMLASSKKEEKRIKGDKTEK